MDRWTDGCMFSMDNRHRVPVPKARLILSDRVDITA
jgi:hypothetical protein